MSQIQINLSVTVFPLYFFVSRICCIFHCFSYLILFHFVLLILVLPLIFSRVQSVYIYYIIYIYVVYILDCFLSSLGLLL